MQRIALEMPADGYRRITPEWQRRGLEANYTRVLRLMHDDTLLCLRKKAFVRTTDSPHRFMRYPHLLPALAVSGVNPLWVADITSMRLQREFVSLAVILDGYSRRCIGWALARSLEAELALVALRMALATRQVQPGLVHHSNRGVQYASHAYTNRLQEPGIRLSMSRGGNPYAHAQAESLIKTLTYEEVYMVEYQDLAEARVRIGHFLDTVYNRKRLHSALGYVPPVEFEPWHGPPSEA